MKKRLDDLMELVEPIFPRGVCQLSKPAQAKFLDLREEYWEVGAIAMMFTPHFKMIRPDLLDLPLRDRISSNAPRCQMLYSMPQLVEIS